MNIGGLVFVAAAFSLTAASTGSAAGNASPVGFKAPLFAALTEVNEVSNEGEANVGDPDGRGSATVIVNPNPERSV